VRQRLVPRDVEADAGITILYAEVIVVRSRVEAADRNIKLIAAGERAVVKDLVAFDAA
jgi:hypothetical protein